MSPEFNYLITISARDNEEANSLRGFITRIDGVDRVLPVIPLIAPEGQTYLYQLKNIGIPEPGDLNFGDYLRLLLRDRKRNQVFIAGGAGVTQSYISQVMNGRRTPSPELLHNIARRLELTPDESANLLRLGRPDKV